MRSCAARGAATLTASRNARAPSNRTNRGAPPTSRPRQQASEDSTRRPTSLTAPSLRRVVVEALPALPAQVTGHDHAPEERRRGKPRLPELLEHDLGHVEGRVETHQVEECERAHRVTTPELHRLVDVVP